MLHGLLHQKFLVKKEKVKSELDLMQVQLLLYITHSRANRDSNDYVELTYRTETIAVVLVV